MTFDVRVRRVSAIPTGKPEHLRADTLDYSASLNEVAALRLQLSQHATVNGSLRAGEELALELWDGTQWTEGEQGRFTSLGLSLDELDPTMATQLDVVEFVSFRLSKALHDVQSDRSFTDVTPGYIVHTLLTEAKSRGAVESVAWTFTATNDSTGAPWPKAVTIDLPPDQSALDTLGVLVEGVEGYIDWTTRGRELVLYVKENAGRKHSFAIGKRALERPFRSSLTDAATAVTVRLDDGKFIRKAGNASLGLGVLERAISASGVTDDATANVLLDAELAAGAPKSELTISENAETLDRVPLVNYDLGDWVWVRRGGAAENVRVSGVQVRKNKGESPTIDIILMDKIGDNAARLAKAAKAVGRVGGNGRFKGAGGGGGGGVSVRYGNVDPRYINYSGNPARVSFDGGATLSDPLDFVSEHPPFAGDRVAVVGTLIVGRIAAEPGEVPGSVELLEPGPGWDNLDVARYGPLRITKTTSEWVIISGMLKRDTAQTGNYLVAHVPGAYLPARDYVKLAAREEGGGSSNYLYLFSSQPSPTYPPGSLVVSKMWSGGVAYIPDTISVCFAYNVQTGDIFNVNNEATGGVDIHGTVFMIHNSRPSSGSFPEAYRPGQTRTMLGAHATNGSPYPRNNQVNTNGTIGGFGAGFTYMSHGLWWQQEGTAHYAWQRLSLINGYTHHATEPIEFTKTPAGIVMIRGMNGGGGVVGQTIGSLPAGFRPSYEHMLPNGLRISPSGTIQGLSTATGGVSTGTLSANCMFIAGR